MNEIFRTTEPHALALRPFVPPKPPKPPGVIIVDEVSDRHFVMRSVRREVTFAGQSLIFIESQIIELPNDPPRKIVQTIP